MSQKFIGLKIRYSPTILEIPASKEFDLRPFDEVIFRDADGKEEYGVIKFVDSPAGSGEEALSSAKVLRRATENDIQKLEKLGEDGQTAAEVCQTLVSRYGLDMQIFAACYSFDGARLYFLFTSEDRVDFRELVKDLAKSFKKQINLRQIGPRDRARMIGGYGKCGRTLCCGSFLGKLESVNMEMVRVQSLESKGSSKLSGTCGKLLCCLKYEVDAYRELRDAMPRIGDRVEFKKKEGKVVAIDILNQKMKLIFEDQDAAVAAKDEIKILTA